MQRQERKKAYEQEIATRMKRGKFSDGDINNLVQSLIRVSDYLQAILRGEDPDAEFFINEYHRFPRHDRTKHNAHEFLGCVQRWLNRAPNVISANIPPFTLTGDINDAIFIIHRTLDDHEYERVYESMDISPPNKYISFIPNSGWNLSHEQPHEYFERLKPVQVTKRISFMDMIFEENETAQNILPSQAKDRTDAMIDNHRSPQEMRKLKQLDDPNRIWKMNRYTKGRMPESAQAKKKFIEQIEQFMQEKLRNILQLKEFDE